jgi:hypothetical protein
MLKCCDRMHCVACSEPSVCELLLAVHVHQLSYAVLPASSHCCFQHVRWSRQHTRMNAAKLTRSALSLLLLLLWLLHAAGVVTATVVGAVTTMAAGAATVTARATATAMAVGAAGTTGATATGECIHFGRACCQNRGLLHDGHGLSSSGC